MSKAQEYRDQAIEEIEAHLDEKRKYLYDIIDAHNSAKKLEKPHLIRKTKKEIARLLTVRAEKMASKATKG